MCGIAGVLKVHEPKDGPPPPHLDAIPESWLDILDEGIKHRGPDGQGRFRDRATRPDGTVVDVALVHRRLSIIDHEGGHQPMVHDGSRLRPDLTYQPGDTPFVASEREPDAPLNAAVFNGCIYNHRELRDDLKAAGHTFHTDHADTEVFIHGWHEWHTDLHQHLDGMHAATVWDRTTGTLTALNDLAGEKPLHRTFDPWMLQHTVVFSSSPASLEQFQARQDPDFRQINILLQDWIRFGYFDWGLTNVIPTPLQSLDLTVERSRNEHAKHWDGPDRETATPPSRDWQGTIELAVASRLEADVPLGVFLSGGIDSALIAAIAKKSRPDLRTFTVRMPVDGYDESYDAAETAAALGTNHTTLDCDPDPSQDLINLIHQLGLPFGDSSLLPTYWVAKAAREHVKVALSGDGADELFGGYRRHTVAQALTKQRALLARIPASRIARRDPRSRGEYLARLAIAAKHRGYEDLLAIFPTPDLQALINQPTGGPAEPEFCDEPDPLRRDFERYLRNDILVKTDTASMAVALEVRAPFLAKELVELALRTPLSVLMPNGKRKGLLKQIAARYLPDHIINRPKRGFAIPIGDWFRTDYGGMRQLLHDHLGAADPFPGLAEARVNINMSFVSQMLREHDLAGEKSIFPWHGRDHSQRLYMLLVLSIWCRWLRSLREPAPPAAGRA